jgi:hypothetical protein
MEGNQENLLQMEQFIRLAFTEIYTCLPRMTKSFLSVHKKSQIIKGNGINTFTINAGLFLHFVLR